MNKLLAFVRLDFITVKPYLTFKNLLIYAALAFFFTIITGFMSSGISIGMMVGVLFLSYPFVIGEKSNMDALYSTLSINRKTVVLGRYLFAIAINCCTILFFLTFSIAGMLVTRISSFESGSGEIIWTIFFLAVLVLVIQALQLPLYFKLGYSKAKFVSMIPFAALPAGFFVISSFDNGAITESLENLFTNVLNESSLIALVVFALLLVLYGSYRLSLLFYKKREF